MSVLEQLIELNRQAAGAAGDRVSRSVRKRVPLLVRLELKVKTAEARLRRRKDRQRRRQIRQLDLEQAFREHRAARTWVARKPGPEGTVNPETQWVGIITAMQPGRWYGTKVLEQLTGLAKPMDHGAKWATRLFVDRALNPKWTGTPASPGIPQGRSLADVRWKMGPDEFIEPRWLWRLNRWGESLRAEVLDNPTASSIRVFALDGAKPDLWREAQKTRRKKKSRGGQFFPVGTAQVHLGDKALSKITFLPKSLKPKIKSANRSKKSR